MIYSQGFNPHPKVALAAPLPLGQISTGEFVDIWFEGEPDLEILPELLNSKLPEGISIMEVREVAEKAASLMSIIDSASYEILIPVIDGFDESPIAAFLEKDEIIVTRQRPKKPVKEVDIRPLIRELQGNVSQGMLILHAIVNTGSKGNLRPEELLTAFENFVEGGLDVDKALVRRTGLYTEGLSKPWE